MPSCTRCLKASPCLHYMVSADSDRYAKCICAGGNVSCDVWGPSKGDWERLECMEELLTANSDTVISEQQ